MLYEVPQFTEYEDKIFGPFTLKQFLVVIAGAGVILLIWTIFDFSLLFWLLAVPIGVITLILALGQINGQSALLFIFPFLGFLSKPKQMVFKQEVTSSVIKTKNKKEKSTAETAQQPEDVKSRLRRLAYVLDQKREEEASLLENPNQQINPNATNTTNKTN